jgi:hypothetical protein
MLAGVNPDPAEGDVPFQITGFHLYYEIAEMSKNGLEFLESS